jgi:hypothetical protein
MRRQGRNLALWAGMMMLCYPAGSRAAEGRILPPDLKPMLDHAAIVSEMMRACGHMRSDLAVQLRAAGAAWWIRNARVQKALAELTEDAARASSKDGGLAPSPSAVSPAKAAEIMGAYKALREVLRRQIEDQVQRGNLNFVRNCDEVLVKLSSGALDYQLPGK